MNAADVLERARSAAGRGCVYALGAGGRDPSAPVPWDATFRIPDAPDPTTGAKRWKSIASACDCSGFAAWAIGISRHLTAKGVASYDAAMGEWFETTAIVKAATAGIGFLKRVPWSQAGPGMLLVYGDQTIDGKSFQGHVGILTEMKDGMPSRVIHCSVGNFRHRGDAIRETDARVFGDRGVTVAISFIDYNSTGA